MRALVTGATGALGRALVRKLVRAGDDVVATSRLEATVEGIRTVAADLTSAPWSTLLDDVEVVFHLAAFVHRVPRDSAERTQVEAVNHRATAALAAACTSAAAKLVFSSSVAVLGPGGDGIGDGAPAAPRSEYGRTKLLAEQAVQAAGVGGLRYAVLRFPLLYGPHGRGNMERMLEAISRRRYWPIGSPDVKKSCLHFDDAAEALLLAARRAVGTFVVAGPAPLRLGDIHSAAYEALGARCPSSSIPAVLARIGGAGIDGALRLLGRSSRLREQVETLTRSAWYDGSRFARETGFVPRIGIDEGLRATAEWMRRVT